MRSRPAAWRSPWPDPAGPSDAPVVVGVDGSGAALQALDWAAARRRPLQVVHAVTWPIQVDLYGLVVGIGERGVGERAERVLQEALT